MEEKLCLNLTQLDGTLDPKLEIKCWEFLQVRISLLMKQYPELSENTVCLVYFILNSSILSLFILYDRLLYLSMDFVSVNI